jgi:YidC/Oxa1 family membrane protein insertase
LAGIVLTQYSGKIVGPIARLIGYIMNSLYMFLNDVFGIQNIAVCIVLFTFIIYFLMMPLTYKQQKFSKLTQVMQPEINAIREKYKNKKDQASMQKMNEETQSVYEKYGVSPMGSCVQMLINFPIFIAMYQVIRNVPAYVDSVKDVYLGLVDKIVDVNGFQGIMEKVVSDSSVAAKLDFSSATTTSNSIIDVLYALPSAGWDILRDNFSGLADVITSTEAAVQHMNNFFGINIANSPLNLITSGWKEKDFILIIGAIMIPLFSYLSQVVNIKLMPTSTSDALKDGNDAMARQMKTMNTMMPLFSLIMVFSVPVGAGIYWIAGSVIRSIQQLVLNRHFKNLDLDAIIEKNKEKAKKKKEKQGIHENQISNTARMNTRKISEPVVTEEKEEKLRQTAEYAKSAKKGSLLEKANMVRDFNERNNR